MNMIGTLIFALLVFSLIIFVHELGHFLTARLFGVKVHEFAIGMGPQLFARQRGETKYSIRAIPMGGFCSMEGEDAASDDSGSFSKKPWYARFVILAAGATMNIILGFLICTLFVTLYYKSVGIPTTTVGKVMDYSPLYDFLKPGDRIISVDGQRVNIKRDIDFIMQQSDGSECDITVKRGSERLTKTFAPYAAKQNDGSAAYLIGFTAEIKPMSVFGVLRESFFQTLWTVKLVFVSLKMLLTGGASVADVSGPVGIVSTMNTAAHQQNGFIALLYLAALISVNIGVMNLLPFPALDGGRIFFVLVEAVRRKPIPPEKEGVVHFIGMALLIALMIVATWNDILRLIGH